MRRIFKDDLQEAEFKKKGYVKVDLIPQETVTTLLNQLQQMRPDDKFDPDGKGLSRSTYHCTFLDSNVEYKRKVSELINSIFTKVMHQYLIDYKILTSNFYVKPPGKGTFQIHQNWPTTENINDTTLTIWTPLVDVDRQNGAIQVVEGSHKIVPDIAAATVPHYFCDFEDELIGKYLEVIPMKAGEGLIFDDSLIHYSGRNTSDNPRYAIQIETLPQEINPVVYYYDVNSGKNEFEIFEVNSEFFIKNSLEHLLTRPKLKSLGFVENRNKILSEQEFVEKLQSGDKTRSVIYG
ncbi:MAG: phytanoyl-CoA dioxygenase family protein [Bacteroidota bacterium]